MGSRSDLILSAPIFFRNPLCPITVPYNLLGSGNYVRAANSISSDLELELSDQKSERILPDQRTCQYYKAPRAMLHFRQDHW